MEWFINLSKEFAAFETLLRQFSLLFGMGLSIASLINFMSKKKNPHKEDVSLFSLFVQQMFCIFLIDLDVVIGIGSVSAFGQNESEEVGNYLPDISSVDVQIASKAAVMAAATLIGRFFGFLAFYNGYCAAGETNDMERKKLFSKALHRYLASIAFVSMGAVYEMWEENYGLDFNVTSRGGHGFSMEAHTV